MWPTTRRHLFLLSSVMIDQANDLRRLVTQSAELPQHAPSRQVKAVLVAGGKGGVGTTTVAVNLAVAAAQQGLRTVLVDADPDGPDVHTLCRLRQRYTLSDVLDGRRTLGETLQAGPGGVMILPGAWATADLADASDASQKRLLDQLAGLGTRADLVVLDGGNGLHSFTRRLWQTCEEVVLVSSTDTNAVLDTYAALKVALVPEHRPSIRLLVNMCDDESDARQVHGRLNRSSRRFLEFDLPNWHWLPADANVVAQARQGVPFTLSQPETVASESLLALAYSLGHDATTRGNGSLPSWRDQQNTTNQENLPNRLNPGGENADSEEDRSLFTRC